MKRFVIVHSEDGVFVGVAMGLCFFSALDAAGQSMAPALPTKEDADEMIQKIAESYEGKGFFFTVEVDCRDTHCDVLALRQAGVRESFLSQMIDNEVAAVISARLQGAALQ